MTACLDGMYAALLTGFADNEDLDEQRQRNIVSHVLRQGLKGLYVGGSTAESGLMTTDELCEQQGIVKDAAKASDVTLIAHVGQPSLRDSIRLARNAESLGYDALSALPPHSYRFTPDEIFHYYKALASATSLPLIVYEVPGRVGRESSVAELSAILGLPGVAGIKFSSMNLFVLSQLRSRHSDSTIFFGSDETYMTGALSGANGGIGSTYNVFGKLYVALDKAMEAGDMDRARELQEISRDYVGHLFEVGVMPGIKLSLQHLGVDCGPCRAPFRILSDAGRAPLTAFLDQADIAPWL
ncbi:dihydrodipicolinate synthase family protein [Aliiruegeria lutimaris]|uniref:N-acetylneuraminate lyase n=1 Tax=Aliiruegeria lutimaris TaxID=571298 RepID=A0A1G8P9G6_9RHOB|nr:dihydrodipicolinate synthase family protein [Aliiruegeria lutimaris]SDI89124.1 N-acetylneuraminate lyase [Aliiruegeria lutimaris]